MKILKKMRIWVLCLFMAIVFTNTVVLSQSINQITATITQFKVFLNGSEKTFENPVVVINGRTYIPLREAAETLGIDVVWDEENKSIYLDNKNTIPVDDDEIIISMYVYPTSTSGACYQIDLSCDGQIATTIGDTTRLEIGENTKNFVSPVTTKYKQLTDEEMEEMTGFISQITSDEKSYVGGGNDGWYVSIVYQNEERRYAYSTHMVMWRGSEHMLEIICKLRNYSPIEIVTYSYGA